MPRLVNLLSLTLLIGMGSMPAQAAVTDRTGAPVAADKVLAPLAFIKFCMHQPHDCTFVRGSKSDADSLNELDRVNREVNGRIRPHHKSPVEVVGTWSIDPLSGDCNDYAVTKRHELMRRGWSSSDLLLSDVDTDGGEPHLVLTVRTRDGDVVLDNLTNEIRPVGATSYRWVKRQSAENPKIWIRASSDGI